MVTKQSPKDAHITESGFSVRNLLRSQEFILFIILVVMMVILAQFNANFLSLPNLLQQGRLMAEIGLIALPMIYIIITGSIDLSVGSIVGLSAILLGYGWQNLGMPLPLAIIFAIAMGTLAGFINGWIITRVGVPPLIQTLATLALYRGLAEGISGGRSVRGYPDWFTAIGDSNFLGIPVQLWMFVVAAVISGIILARTPFGRSIYAIGNNEVGARFAGIPVDLYKIAIYAASGFMSGVVGWIFVARVTTTRSDMGTGFELDVIAAVVLGGTSIFGGSGSVLGTVIALVLIQLLKNGLALSGITGDATIVIVGVVLILSILVNNFIRGRGAES